MGIAWQHELLYTMGSPVPCYRRLDPDTDYVWIDVKGKRVYRASRWQDEDWKKMLDVVNAFRQWHSQNEESLTMFEKVLEDDAEPYRRARLAEELCREVEFTLLR